MIPLFSNAAHRSRPCCPATPNHLQHYAREHKEEPHDAGGAVTQEGESNRLRRHAVRACSVSWSSKGEGDQGYCQEWVTGDPGTRRIAVSLVCSASRPVG